MDIRLPKNYLFYACTKDHGVMVTVTNNNAIMSKSGSGVGLHLAYSFYGSQAPPELVEEMADREWYTEDTTDMRAAMLTKATLAVREMEERYNWGFFRGDIAWADRLCFFSPMKEKWNKYTMDMGGNIGIHILLDEWDKVWTEQKDKVGRDYHHMALLFSAARRVLEKANMDRIKAILDAL